VFVYPSSNFLANIKPIHTFISEHDVQSNNSGISQSTFSIADIHPQLQRIQIGILERWTPKERTSVVIYQKYFCTSFYFIPENSGIDSEEGAIESF